MATVIVHQNPVDGRKAALTTAIYITDPDTRFHDRAHSLESVCMPSDILRLSGAEELRTRRALDGHGICTIHHELPPLPLHAPIQVFHGQGFHVRVPSTLSIAEAEDNLEMRLTRDGSSHGPRVGDLAPERTTMDEAPEDTSSFMARSQALLYQQARQNRDTAPSSSHSDSSMSTTSSASSTLDIRQTVLVLLNGRTVSAPLPWNRPLGPYAAQACDIRADQVLNLHYVSHRPADFQQADLQCLLVQTTEDQPISHFLRLVLIDIEFYGTQELQPFAFRRLAKWLPHIINRRSVFRMVELDDQYVDHFERCHLWHNNRIIEASQIIPMRLADGDYLKVYIGDHPEPSSCASSASRSEADLTDESWHPEDQTNETFSTFQLSSTTIPQVPLHRELRVHASDVRTPSLHDQSHDATHHVPLRGSLRFHPDDLKRLRRLFAVRSFIECEDEGPVAYVDTWFIHHQLRPDCLESRAIKLHHDSPNWLADLIEPWTGELDPAEEAIVHLVQPQPPCTMMECVLAHLIIEQSHRPQHGVGLISTSSYDRATPGRNTISHRAFSLPQLMNAPMVFRHIGLFDTCQRQRCRIRRGRLPFSLVDWEELPRAVCLTVYYDRVLEEQPADDSDSSELFQISIDQQRRPQAGLDLPTATTSCENFQFNPNAPVFEPSLPVAPPPPARWSELHRHWNRLAFSWEGEARYAVFTTWFVDQHNPALRRCAQPRRVSLSDDFRSWDAAFRQAWPDRAVAGAPFLIHVVHPQPTPQAGDDSVQVLLVQNPQDGLSTSLITGYDEQQVQEGPSFQIAFTTNEQFLLDHLLIGLGLIHRCLPPERSMQCQAWHDQTPIVLGWPLWLARWKWHHPPPPCSPRRHS